MRTHVRARALRRRYPLLLVGPTGTGKTAYTASYIAGLNPELFTPPNTLGFSAQTSAAMAQALVDAKLDKRRKARCGTRRCVPMCARESGCMCARACERVRGCGRRAGAVGGLRGRPCARGQ